jgi:hypothetical protein
MWYELKGCGCDVIQGEVMDGNAVDHARAYGGDALWLPVETSKHEIHRLKKLKRSNVVEID